MRISATEENVSELQNKVKTLEGKYKDLEEKLLDLEARSRRPNLRLVNLPEGAEGEDTCAFLESWIPEALELAQKAHCREGAQDWAKNRDKCRTLDTDNEVFECYTLIKFGFPTLWRVFTHSKRTSNNVKCGGC